MTVEEGGEEQLAGVLNRDSRRNGQQTSILLGLGRSALTAEEVPNAAYVASATSGRVWTTIVGRGVRKWHDLVGGGRRGAECTTSTAVEAV